MRLHPFNASTALGDALCPNKQVKLLMDENDIYVNVSIS